MLKQEPTVDIIASGYEWICPHCKMHNTEIEILEIVVCQDCKDWYLTNPAEHACG